MNCAVCSHPMVDGARFCAKCGAATGAEAVNPAPPGLALANAAGGTSTAAAAAWDDMKKQFPGLLERAKNILLKPNVEWPIIAAESSSTGKLYTGYIVPLATIGPLASIIGLSLVGISVPFLGTVRTPILSSALYAVVAFILALVGVFVLALIIDALAPTFSGEKNQGQALKVAAYSYTPAWLAGILSLVPMLSMLVVIAAIYSLYLLYLGLPILMKAPKEKALGYTAVVVICAIVLGVIVSVISGTVMGTRGMSLMGMHGNAMEREAASEKAGAAAAGALVGGLLGQDDKSKAAIGSAIGQMAEYGRQMEQGPAQTKATTGPDKGQAADASVSPKDIAAATGALGALGNVLSGGKTVEPVDFRALKAMLPESLPGMTRSNASGEKNEMTGIQVSTAEADYQDSASGRIHIKISDLGTLTSLAGMAAAIEPKLDKETDNGYEKTMLVNGRQTHESYDKRSQQGELKVLLDGRFEVELRGKGLQMDAIKSALGAIDFNRLEAMKTQGVSQR
jgi:Yip1-like protein